jgi:hypothetical protein
MRGGVEEGEKRGRHDVFVYIIILLCTYLYIYPYYGVREDGLFLLGILGLLFLFHLRVKFKLKWLGYLCMRIIIYTLVLYSQSSLVPSSQSKDLKTMYSQSPSNKIARTPQRG